jgi:hypothetical protein
VNGDAVIGIMYNGNAAEAMRADPDFRYVLPEDGTAPTVPGVTPKDVAVAVVKRQVRLVDSSA